MLDKIAGLFGTPKEKRTQLFFRDDGKFVFRKLFVEDTFLVEKNQNNEIIKGWKLFYKLQFPFYGHGSISADMVTLSFDRDIILDPFGIISEDEKPEKGLNLDKGWITDVADGQRYKAQTKPQSMLLIDKITLFLGITLVIMVLALAYRAVT